MFKKQELVMKTMTLKEKVKFILVCLLAITMLTGALFFFTSTSGAVMKYIFTGADTFYYDWRDVLILLFFPVMVYFDIFVFLLLFTPFTLQLARLWHKAINIIWGYTIIVFFLTIPLSIVMAVYILNSYNSCGQKGPFSGAHYVKDLKMCEQFEYHPDKDESERSSIIVRPEVEK